MKIREKKKGAQGKKQKNKYSLRTRLRGWFHHGRFIGFDIQSIIMAVLRLVNLVFFIVSIIGIVDAASGRARKFPLIGNFTLIK